MPQQHHQPTVIDATSQMERLSIAEEQHQWMTQLGQFLMGDLQLRKPHQLRRASEVRNAEELGEAMPLVAREDALQQLYDVSLRQFDAWINRDLQNSNLRKKIRVPTCCGASGIGKTRFSSQAFYLMHERIQAGAEVAWRSDAPAGSDVARFRSALARCVQGGLVLEVNAANRLESEEIKNPECSVAMRTLYQYCQRYRLFSAKYPSYNLFFATLWNEAFACRLKFTAILRQIAKWEQLEEEQYLLLVIHVDETNLVPIEYVNLCVSAITTSWHLEKSVRVFALPLLSGTNPTDVYRVSGEGPMNLQLPLLGVDDYVAILRGLLGDDDDEQDGFVPREPIKRLLADLAYNPRLLAVGLSAMSVHGRALLQHQRQQQRRRASDEAAALSPKVGLESLPFDLELLRVFLDSASTEHCSMAFKTAVSNLGQANLLTLDYWRNDDQAELRQLVLAHCVLDVEVSLTKKLGGVTVGELINQGVAFLDGGRFLMLPYAYLYVLFRDTTQSSRGRALQLLATPTRHLSPDDNEAMDLNTALYRLDLHRLVGHAECMLSQLLRLGGLMSKDDDVRLQIPVEKLEPKRSHKQLTFFNAAKYIETTYNGGQKQAWTIINARGAPSFDSAIFMTASGGSLVDPIPACYYAQHIPDVKHDQGAKRAVKKLQKMATFKNHRFLDDPPRRSVNRSTRNLFAIFIQSRRTASSALSKQEVWEEYLKVSGFAETLPFVLVIITDKHATVPAKLAKQVLAITDDELDAFFGRILAGRRRESS